MYNILLIISPTTIPNRCLRHVLKYKCQMVILSNLKNTILIFIDGKRWTLTWLYDDNKGSYDRMPMEYLKYLKPFNAGDN